MGFTGMVGLQPTFSWFRPRRGEGGGAVWGGPRCPPGAAGCCRHPHPPRAGCGLALLLHLNLYRASMLGCSTKPVAHRVALFPTGAPFNAAKTMGYSLPSSGETTPLTPPTPTPTLPSASNAASGNRLRRRTRPRNSRPPTLLERTNPYPS
jgi:hypothetical protein